MDYDSELVNKIRPSIRVICISFIIVMSINCIAIWKWRWLSSCIIYLETVYQIFPALASVERGAYVSESSVILYCALFAAYYTGDRAQIIITTNAFIVFTVMIETFIFKEEITFGYVATRMMLTIVFFGTLVVLAMVFKYIEILELRL